MKSAARTPARSIPVRDALRALADPTRVRLLRLLRGGPLCVGDLVAVLEALQPKVSRHLAFLHRAGLIQGERRGGFSFYGLVPAQAGFHRKLLALLDAAAAELPDARKDQASLSKLQAKGGCCPQHMKPRARG
jgi:ArsR family transcriptional regulator